MSDIEEKIVNLVATKSDADLAESFRQEAKPHLDAWADIASRAKSAGFLMSFNISPDSFGRVFRVTEITVVKPL
jgi:hypothetical protein